MRGNESVVVLHKSLYVVLMTQITIHTYNNPFVYTLANSWLNACVEK